MEQISLATIKDFEKRTWAMKRYAAERWGVEVPCPVRFVVNPYYGCSIRCPYCYVWFDKKIPTIKPGFRKALKHDICRAKKMGMCNLTVEVSSSTDPFQKLENLAGDSLFAVDELLKAGFIVVIVTKNPKILLEEKYRHLLRNERLFIDVTITGLESQSLSGIITVNEELSEKEKIDVVATIIAQEKKAVRVRIDPIVPNFVGVNGQTEIRLANLVKKLSQIGVKLIISKTLRLNAGLSDESLNLLGQYYKKNGVLIGENYILNKGLRKELLKPIFESCKNYSVAFCPCCDEDVFASERVNNCYVANEVRQL